MRRTTRRLPTRTTGQALPHRLTRDGTVTRPHNTLREQIRQAEGRNRPPSAALIDSPSLRGADDVQDRDAGHLLTRIPHTVFPTIRHVRDDGDYATTLQIVSKLAGQTAFVVLPRRWCVERTCSWINRCRRTVTDYERLPDHHAAIIYWAMAIIMARRQTTTQPTHDP